ncbi:MAG: WbuC family cupin fold metalloprotein [Bacteroidales bacterium]|nr:WbuC family cupin fold metalloprotein [Bacteroidales bacterium]
MIRINEDFLNQTTSKAKESERLRMNYNFHPHLEDPISRMLNAMEPGTYIQPHKHQTPDRFEVFLVLRGRFVVFIFNDDGIISDHYILDACDGNYGVEIPARIFHSLMSLESGSVAYEIKEGPYQPATAKNFAPWAPAEGDAGAEAFMEKLLDTVGLNNKT